MSDWNAWHTLLAVINTGTFDGAARQLGVNATTVSRRIRQLEAIQGSPLLVREGGQLVASDSAQMVLPHLNKAADALATLIPQRPQTALPSRRVIRVTATPFLCEALLAPALNQVRDSGNLRIELVGDNRNLNLARREADFALRFSSLEGERITCRSLPDVAYSVFAHKDRDPSRLPWANGDHFTAHVISVRWVTEKAARTTGVAYTSTSQLATKAIVAAGVARALLPRFIAIHDPDLVEVEPAALVRQLWLITHRESHPTDDHIAIEQWISQQAGRLLSS